MEYHSYDSAGCFAANANSSDWLGRQIDSLSNVCRYAIRHGSNWIHYYSSCSDLPVRWERTSTISRTSNTAWCCRTTLFLPFRYSPFTYKWRCSSSESIDNLPLPYGLGRTSFVFIARPNCPDIACQCAIGNHAHVLWKPPLETKRCDTSQKHLGQKVSFLHRHDTAHLDWTQIQHAQLPPGIGREVNTKNTIANLF